jgi:hypothetical protein
MLIVTLTITSIWLIHYLSPSPIASTNTPSASIIQANAAALGVEVFFQVNSEEGKDAWLNRICAVSTENGCALIRMGADRLWEKYDDAGISVYAEATPVELISATQNEQVWKVDVHLLKPLPGSNKTDDVAHVLIVKSGDDWKFERFLFEPEVQAMQERQKKESQP